MADEHAVVALGRAEVISFALPANVASQAVMRKLGMQPAGEIVRAHLPHLLFGLAQPAT